MATSAAWSCAAATVAGAHPSTTCCSSPGSLPHRRRPRRRRRLRRRPLAAAALASPPPSPPPPSPPPPPSSSFYTLGQSFFVPGYVDPRSPLHAGARLTTPRSLRPACCTARQSQRLPRAKNEVWHQSGTWDPRPPAAAGRTAIRFDVYIPPMSHRGRPYLSRLADIFVRVAKSRACN